VNRKSRYNIKIDFDKSNKSFIFDKNTKTKYLDFFGQYVTLALGYNNKIFKSKEFINDMMKVSKQKIVNNEILSDESKNFDKIFSNFTSKNIFEYFHYFCTGSLAVEAAIKTAMDYKKIVNPQIISFKGSFHGINGYGGIITDRFEPVNQRLKGFPGNYWKQFNNSIYEYNNNKKFYDEEKLNQTIDNIEKTLIKKKTCCILIEPIQATYGDHYFPMLFFKKIRTLCNKYDVPLIFDEIQTGFYATGKTWYYEHTNITPDILIFGKKTQLSGIMVKKKFNNIFKKPIRLEVTWDADIVDMVRCKYIIEAYKKDNVIQNVKSTSKLFLKKLNNIKDILNIRNSGLLFAIDLRNIKIRDKFVDSLTKYGLLCNPTKNNTVRFRPFLSVNNQEIDLASNIIEKASMDAHK